VLWVGGEMRDGWDSAGSEEEIWGGGMCTADMGLYMCSNIRHRFAGGLEK
jgi:hypothetical protein